ncbi:MAG: 2-C-methyl-D-erythritol 4-phosphate cytidylyltransferase [Lachnospiraceae bacterium]|nr:2-C-methyl-D-erythritol 4-phosphate cytidylyltransferase [Lachnospiraceae bacterium]
MKKRCTAVVLAAGSGKRMKSHVVKQFMELDGKPLIWYALRAVEDSEIIDDCILVTGEEDIPYVHREIVEKYDFRKIDTVTAGGAERCFSVANALRVIAREQMRVANRDGYVFIHDGARPFLTREILWDTYCAVEKYHACVAAVPSKDTVKIADENGFVAATPARELLWSIQTPQVFDTKLIVKAYEMLLERWDSLREQGIAVTDDAGVVELFTDTKVKLVPASYGNIKITTPEDLAVAESLLAEKV